MFLHSEGTYERDCGRLRLVFVGFLAFSSLSRASRAANMSAISYNNADGC